MQYAVAQFGSSAAAALCIHAPKVKAGRAAAHRPVMSSVTEGKHVRLEQNVFTMVLID